MGIILMDTEANRDPMDRLLEDLTNLTSSIKRAIASVNTNRTCDVRLVEYLRSLQTEVNLGIKLIQDCKGGKQDG